MQKTRSDPARLLLEVIVQSVADAVAATDGGADRLEVVRAIEHGGLTPSLSLVRDIIAATPLPLRVMVRENAGYSTTPEEIVTLRRQAADFADLGVDGLVVGFADDGKLQIDALESVLADTPGARVTFHRAFEAAVDRMRAVDTLATVAAVDSVLTSGGDGDPPARCARLKELATRAAGRLRIIAGGGVDEAMFAELTRSRCVGDVHVGRLARDRWDQRAPVSAGRVRQLRRAADEAARNNSGTGGRSPGTTTA